MTKGNDLFKQALIKIIDRHQKEFETLIGEEIAQVNQSGPRSIQIVFKNCERAVELMLCRVAGKFVTIR